MAATGVFSLTRFTGLAAGDVLPAVDISDSTQNAHGSLDAITVTNFFGSIPVPVVVTSASANALAVGLAGSSNSAFLVDCSTALQVAGLKVTGAVTGGTVAVVVTDSGLNASLTVNAKGSGTIGIGSVSTGRVTITPVTTIAAPLTVTSTTATQLKVGYDGSDYFTADVSSAGAVTLAATGSGAGFGFSNPIGAGATPNQNAPAGNTAGLEVVSVSGTRRILTVTGYTETSVHHFQSARGSITVPANLVQGDSLMSIGARAWDGTGFNGSSLAIQGFADESSSGVTTCGAYLTLETSANGANARTVAVLIDQSKYVGIGLFSAATRPAAPLHILNTATQVRVAYDGSNYYTTAVSSAGAVVFDATGASAGFTFSDAVIASSTLAVTGNVSVNTNKFTVTASNGNILVAGTAALNGVVTVGAAAANSIIVNGQTTGASYAGFSNTGGNGIVGINASVTIVGNGSAYSTFAGSNNATAFELLTNGSVRMGIVGAAGTPANSSLGNIFILNGTAPTGNPTGMGFLWVESGALKYRGTSGTITTVAPA